MKKIIALAMVAVAAVSMATAEITVGARGMLGWSLGSSLPEEAKAFGYKFDAGKSFDFGFAAFVNIPLVAGIGIQPELGFSHNSVGMKISQEFFGESYTGKGWFSYNAIDIPVLVTYGIKVNDSLTITPLLGPKFSIPVGKIKSTSEMNGEKFESDPVKVGSPLLFGIVFGADVAFKLGPGAIVGDIRYDLGLTKLKQKYEFAGQTEKVDLVTPRALTLSVGYQLAF